MKRVRIDDSAAYVSRSFARHKQSVKIAGGFNMMDPRDADGMLELFSSAFSMVRNLRLIAGASRTIIRESGLILNTVGEIGPYVKTRVPEIELIGVIPDIVGWEAKSGKAGQLNSGSLYSTIHPHYHQIISLSGIGDGWKREAIYSARLFKRLRIKGEQVALVVYNGGEYSEFELELHVNAGLPVVLVQGSGRLADRYASDSDFLSRNENVLVAEKNPYSLANALSQIGITNPSAERRMAWINV